MYRQKYRWMIVLLVLAMGLTLGCKKKTAPPEGSKDKGEKKTTALQAKPVVSAKWLKKNLVNPKLVVINVGPEDLYKKEHIAGSRSLYTLKGLSPTQGQVKNETITDKKVMEKTLRKLGIRQGQTLVLVWNGKATKHAYYATKAYFVLTNYGLSVSILNGGLKAWKKGGGEVTSDVPEVTEGNVVLDDFNQKALVKLDEMKKVEARFDARPEGFYKGEKKKDYVARPGTISNSKNLSFQNFLTKDGKFKSGEEIVKILDKHRVGDGATFFCNSGMSASLAWFAAHAVGGKKARLYDGSMNEWAADEKNPMVKGKK